MQSGHTFENSVSNVAVPAIRLQAATWKKFSSVQAVKEGKDRNRNGGDDVAKAAFRMASCQLSGKEFPDYDSDDAAEAALRLAPCQLPGDRLYTDAMEFTVSAKSPQFTAFGSSPQFTAFASSIGNAPMEKQTWSSDEEDAVTPKMHAIPFPSRVPLEHVPTTWVHRKAVVGGTAVPHQGRGRVTAPPDSTADGSRIRTPSPPWQRSPYTWEDQALLPPVLSHMPQHLAVLLGSAPTESPSPALMAGKNGETVVSAGSAGHPFCCARPCKYYSKSNRGCKDGERCTFCHLCPWTKKCRKNPGEGPHSP
mmetsp:Transcript_8266/g.22742  ORF Transcript_8266/g.22742 Transcript_8266/m.22742 type:complete len:308 (-) Transcript_8266:8-931(-)